MGNGTDFTLRGLRPGDLDRVVEIDGRLAGRPRRLFYEKRLAAALADPDGFISVAVEDDAALVGFAIARLQTGEFGEESTVAVLDVIGVDPERQHHGVGTRLLAGLVEHARKRGIRELRTQVAWSQGDVLAFFAHEGFALAPNAILERPTGREL
jgi:GNAT superfamily N-acetyltransferase